jgi:hypothetical protein
MGSQGAEEAGTYPRDSVEAGYGSEGAVGITICDDRLGERQTHTRKARELSCGSRIGIETLTQPKWPSLPHGTVPLRRG